jgi:threonine synthase
MRRKSRKENKMDSTDTTLVETGEELAVFDTVDNEERLQVSTIRCANCGVQFEIAIAVSDAAVTTLPKNWISTNGVVLNQTGVGAKIRNTVTSNGPWCSRKCFLHWASRELKGDE